MRINKHDTNGTKPLLAVGELGYDNYPSGGDIGRVFVGTGTQNIAQAKKSEVVTVDGKVDTHVARIDNPHGVTKAQVGLSNVDNTADITKVVASAGKWTTGRLINGTSVDGTVNITTSQWGTSRNITIGNTPKTVNGSGDVSWTLTEIGAIGASSPAFTGIPTAPTAPVNNNSNQIATTAYVASQVANTAVALTGNQTIAGVKTFSSSPIVPTPTTDFQSVPLKSTNLTVNVGAGQTYTTINQALEYLSGFYPMYKQSGVIATINLKAGFVMAEQVLVSGIDLGWITIVGEDSETIITHTALITSFYGSYPVFGVDKGGTSPIIGQLFRFNVEKVGGNKHGLMTFGAGSSADVLTGKGFKGAGTNGVFATYGSSVNAAGANCSNAGAYGIYAVESSAITANGANCSNAGSIGICAEQSSTVSAYGAIIQNQTTGTARMGVYSGSNIGAYLINTTGGTVPVSNQAVNTLTANGIIYQ